MAACSRLTSYRQAAENWQRVEIKAGYLRYVYLGRARSAAVSASVMVAISTINRAGVLIGGSLGDSDRDTPSLLYRQADRQARRGRWTEIRYIRRRFTALLPPGSLSHSSSSSTSLCLRLSRLAASPISRIRQAKPFKYNFSIIVFGT